MKRKGMGKRIAAIVLAITMSISTAGFQTGIVKAEVAEGPTTVETTTTETTTAETPAESGDSAADVESADETATDSTITEGNETNDEGSIGEETTDPVITDEEATGDVVDEENADEETTGDASEEDEIADGEETADEEIADEELTPEELAAKLAAEEEARLAAEKEAARIRAELLATSPEIISQYTEGNVTVNVQAPEGAFPGGTTVSIAPVYQTNDLVDAIDGVETTEDIVAFDITFYDIDGYEIQPRDGYTVNVSFELAASSELARDDATLQVYHIDDAQNATPVGAEIPSSSEGVEVSVEAESFSVYAVAITQSDNKGTITGSITDGEGKIEVNAPDGYNQQWKFVAKEGSNVSSESKNEICFWKDKENPIAGIKGNDQNGNEWWIKATGNTEGFWGGFDKGGWTSKVTVTASANAPAGDYTLQYTYTYWKGIRKYTDTIDYTITIYASAHTVTFVYGDENKVEQSVENGSMVEKPADPTRKGYVFLGWYNGEEEYNFDTPITGDLTLTARWMEGYKAEFYLLKNVNVIPLENGSTQYPTTNYTAKDSKNMVGVVTDVKHVVYDDQTDVTGLNIAKAFQPVQEVIAEKPDADYLGTIKNAILTAQGYTENLENYDILWYVVKKAGGTYHVDGVVYDTKANYKTLTYDANTPDETNATVTGLPASVLQPLGSKVSVTDQKPSLSGYTFTGWNTQADGSGDSVGAGAELELGDNITLYAQWEKNVTTKTDVNFYIQLFNEVMDTDGNIDRRPTDVFSGSVAKSKMNINVPTTFKYAGGINDAAGADNKIRTEYLEKTDCIESYPGDKVVFDRLQEDGKTKKHCTDNNINIRTLNSDNYNIYWYVVKYDPADGWHVDGILKEKSQNPGGDTSGGDTPGGDKPGGGDNPGGGTSGGGGNPGGGNPGGSNPGGGSTPGDPGTTVIPDDDTPLAPNPGNDVNDDSNDDTSDVPTDTDDAEEITDIDDEDVPLSDGTDIDDEDVPLADLPEDDAEVTTIDDEDVPLSDNPLTGDSTSVLWAIMAMMAAFGLTAVAVTGKRKREE